jgi:hypothetical protein
VTGPELRWHPGEPTHPLSVPGREDAPSLQALEGPNEAGAAEHVQRDRADAGSLLRLEPQVGRSAAPAARLDRDRAGLGQVADERGHAGMVLA